jgi:pimeloyl-ACP methyl ester carboxylesterase
VSFDFLGFGQSAKPDGAVYNFAQQLGDLEAVVDALKLERIIPVAHDAAGPTAINYTLAHRDRVAELHILNSLYALTPAIRMPELIEVFASPSCWPPRSRRVPSSWAGCWACSRRCSMRRCRRTSKRTSLK